MFKQLRVGVETVSYAARPPRIKCQLSQAV
jgi:hypothetical protein